MKDWRDRIVEWVPPEGTPGHDRWLRAKRRKSVWRKLIAVAVLAGLVWLLQECAEMGRQVQEIADAQSEIRP